MKFKMVQIISRSWTEHQIDCYLFTLGKILRSTNHQR